MSNKIRAVHERIPTDDVGGRRMVYQVGSSYTVKMDGKTQIKKEISEIVFDDGFYKVYVTSDSETQLWKEIPATSAESDAMSKELKKLGFKFVGSTICYAFMQAAGMVNDHQIDCYRYEEIVEMSNKTYF